MPSIYHQRVLLVGVVLALVSGAVFIAIGAAALAAFAFTFVIFGAILIWTTSAFCATATRTPTPRTARVVRQVRKIVPVTDQYDGSRLFTRIDGKKVATAVPRHDRDRVDRPALRARLDPGDLRRDPGGVPGLHGQRLRAAWPAGALLPAAQGLLDKLVYLSLLGLSIILIFIGGSLCCCSTRPTCRSRKIDTRPAARDPRHPRGDGRRLVDRRVAATPRASRCAPSPTKPCRDLPAGE
ncbi:MAG: hypothetical protein U0S36_14835 [Candidatus Nanopelagicales bacterium]